MRTIPDNMLDRMAEHRPDLAIMIANLRAYPDQAPQIEKALATAYLYGETHLSGLETWHLAQVSYGGPWGGDWWPLARAAGETGYDHGTLRRMINDGNLSGLKYGKTWYVRCDALPRKETTMETKLTGIAIVDDAQKERYQLIYEYSDGTQAGPQGSYATFEQAYDEVRYHEDGSDEYEQVPVKDRTDH